MPLTPRQLCANLSQLCGSKSTGYYYETVLAFLCNIANGAGYHHLVLCDVGTGAPVIVRYLFAIDGVLSTEEDAVTAFNVDGTPYEGDIVDLIACAGGEGESAALTEAEFAEVDETAFGALTDTFTNIFANAEQLVYMLILNQTNEVVEFSFDGGVTRHLILNPNESRRYEFAQNRRRFSEDVWARYVTGAAPAEGSVKIEAYA